MVYLVMEIGEGVGWRELFSDQRACGRPGDCGFGAGLLGKLRVMLVG